MKQKNCSSMADIAFWSISGFLQHVEASAELEQVATSAIFSFKIPKGGVDLLIKRKEFVLNRLAENNRKLSVWVGRRSEDLNELQLVVLRSMYITTKGSIDLVTSHLERARKLKDLLDGINQLSLDVREGGEDALPF